MDFLQADNLFKEEDIKLVNQFMNTDYKTITWVEIMEIFEFINELDDKSYSFQIHNKLGLITPNFWKVENPNNIQTSAPTTLEAVWRTIINFIKWYSNETNTNNLSIN